MSGEAGRWAGRGALLGRASAVSGGALGQAGTATRERSWAEAEEGDWAAVLGLRASRCAGLLHFAGWATGLGKRGRGKGLGLGVELCLG